MTAVTACATASCSGAQNMMAPAGPAAQRIAAIGWFVLIVFTAVTLVMWLLIFWLAARRRGTIAEHLPWDAPEDRRWIVVGGFTIPAIAFATIFVVMLRTMAAFPMGDGEMYHMPANVRLIGHQWWWEVQYLEGGIDRETVTGANEIHIPAGMPVDIDLETHDVIHSFWVPQLHGKVDLVPGMVNRIRVQADQPGTYRGECAEYCGAQHAHMILYVIAHSRQDYQTWLDRTRQPAVTPSDAFAHHGQDVFMRSECVRCHTIRGTNARGTAGPDLTHLASRRGIAANTFPNETATLAAWVTHAQSLKPNAQMPDITAFTGEELRALVAYLQTLR
jgi:cytochrome c oxidase subunit 2